MAKPKEEETDLQEKTFEDEIDKALAEVGKEFDLEDGEELVKAQGDEEEEPEAPKKKAKKPADEEEEEPSEPPEEEEEGEGKSIFSAYAENEELMRGFEVSEFLEQFGTTVGEAFEGLANELKAYREESKRRDAALAKALKATLTLAKSMSDELGEIGMVPRPRKSGVVLRKSVAGDGEGGGEPVDRKTILAKSLEAARKGEITPIEVSRIETELNAYGSVVDQGLLTRLGIGKG
jgi:hypothetical protein